MRATLSAIMDCLGTPKSRLKWSTMVDTKGRHMMRLAMMAGSAIPSAVRRPSPPQVTFVVTCHQEKIAVERGAYRGLQMAVKRNQQVLVKEVPVDARVIHE